MRGSRGSVVSGIRQCVLAFFWPPASAILTHWLVVDRIAIQSPKLGLAVSAILFVVVVILFSFTPLGVHSPSSAFYWSAADITCGLAVFLALVSLVLRMNPAAVFLAYFPVYLAAAAEELVFRKFIPGQLSGRLVASGYARKNACVVGCVVAQLSFATSHFAITGGDFNFLIFNEFCKLFAIGLFFAEIVALLGVGFASVVHATINVAISVWLPGPPMVGFIVVPCFAFLCLILLWLRCVELRRSGFTTVIFSGSRRSRARSSGQPPDASGSFDGFDPLSLARTRR